MESLEAILERMRQNHLKITPQRRLILKSLINDDSHPTADEIYQHIVTIMPDVSRATVYNTLHELVDLRALASVQDLNVGGLRYDTNTAPHHHLFCTRCHALIDITRDFEGINLTSKEAAGYQITRHQVTFYGLCPDCQQPNGT